MSLSNQFWDHVFELIYCHVRSTQQEVDEVLTFVESYRVRVLELAFVVGRDQDVLVVDDGGLSFRSEYPLDFVQGIDFRFVAENHAKNVWDHIQGEARLSSWREKLD